MNGIENICEVPAGARRAKARRVFGGRISLCRAFLLAFLTGVANGCYVYTPVQSAPPSGETVSFRLNDAGRVALGQSLGPAVDRIEGVVVSVNDSAYVLNMRSVTYFTGQANVWSGERVSVGKAFVFDPSARRFSRSRTALTIVGGVAVVVGFIVTRGLLGQGSPDTDPPGGGEGPTQIRVPSR